MGTDVLVAPVPMQAFFWVHDACLTNVYARIYTAGAFDIWSAMMELEKPQPFRVTISEGKPQVKKSKRQKMILGSGKAFRMIATVYIQPKLAFKYSIWMRK